MIRCNLAVILAEQNLKANKVSADTGISRTTLTSLTSNNAQGVQFDTLDTLCMYLKVPLERLLSFVPINLIIKSTFIANDLKFEMLVIIEEPNQSSYYTICGKIYFYGGADKEHLKKDIDFNVKFFQETNIDISGHNTENKYNQAKKIFDKLPKSFFNEWEYFFKDNLLTILEGNDIESFDFAKNIKGKFSNYDDVLIVKNKIKNKEVNIFVDWDNLIDDE